MAVQVCAASSDPWALLEEVAPLDPWCLELDEARGVVEALFPEDPAALGPAWARVPPEARRFGSGWRPEQRATQVGPIWVITPSQKVPAGVKRPVVIDALVAFGAGTHETTQLCLERIVEGSPVAEVLDVGTGSGVLAIAALVLGARRAVGIDLEDRLLEETKKNARASGVADRLTVTCAAPDALGRRFPFVIANVRTPALIGMASALLAATEPGGDLVLSGIRVEEKDELLPVFERLGARSAVEACRGDWLRLDLVAPT